MKTTLTIDNYTVTIEPDETAENPLLEFDLEPPIDVYSGSLSSYGGPDICQLVALIPAKKFARGNRVSIIRQFFALKEFAREKRSLGYDDRDTLVHMLEESHSCHGWSAADEYFSTLEELAKIAGITTFRMTSTGYSQGDMSMLMAFALPEWVNATGCPKEHQSASLKASCENYGAWLWGDVYGVSEMTDPDGEDVEEAACWGFYGSDYEQSGLMEHVRSIIEWHKQDKAKREADQAEWEAKEAAESLACACRDIATA